MLDLNAVNIFAIEYAQVPDVALPDVLAESLPGLDGWVLTATTLIFLPEPSEIRQRDMRAEDEVSDLTMFEVASLGHHDDIHHHGIDMLTQNLRLRNGDPRQLRLPDKDRTLEDQVTLRECSSGPASRYQGSLIVCQIPRLVEVHARCPSAEFRRTQFNHHGEKDLPRPIEGNDPSQRRVVVFLL